MWLGQRGPQLLPARWLDRTLLEAPSGGLPGPRPQHVDGWRCPGADLARRGGGAAEFSQAGACAPVCERTRVYECVHMCACVFCPGERRTPCSAPRPATPENHHDAHVR